MRTYKMVGIITGYCDLKYLLLKTGVAKLVITVAVLFRKRKQWSV